MSDPNATTEMTPERALSINAILVKAWMIREGMKSGSVPSVRTFSPIEAVEASNMMMSRGLGRSTNQDGTTTLTCFVSPNRVDALYTWALATWADEGALT